MYDDTIKAWDDVARTEGRSVAIHPAGSDWEAYERSGFEGALEVMRIAKAYKIPVRETRVLDYGCGDGRVARHLGRWTVVGYDTSDEMRNAFISVAPAHFIATNSLKPFLRGMTSLVYSFAVWIHHSYADGARMLKELAQATPGALLALQIPIYSVPREPENWTDVGVWTKAQMEAACAEAGIEILELHTNPGAFSYEKIGPNHGKLQVLRCPR